MKIVTTSSRREVGGNSSDFVEGFCLFVIIVNIHAQTREVKRVENSLLLKKNKTRSEERKRKERESERRKECVQEIYKIEEERRH